MNYVEMLKNCDLKSTPQRICILEALDEHTHPSMDELYEKILARHPSISLATVYKNLNLLKEKGLIVEVNLPNQKTRYDINAYPHIHVVCSHCGYVFDLHFDECEIAKFKENLEKKLLNPIECIKVVASVKNCKHCS